MAASPSGDLLRADIPVELANTLLSADYTQFLHTASDTQAIRTLSYTIPPTVQEHLSFIYPTSQYVFSKFALLPSDVLLAPPLLGLYHRRPRTMIVINLSKDHINLRERQSDGDELRPPTNVNSISPRNVSTICILFPNSLQPHKATVLPLAVSWMRLRVCRIF